MVPYISICSFPLTSGQVFKKVPKEKKKSPRDHLDSASEFHPKTSNPVAQKPKRQYLQSSFHRISCFLFFFFTPFLLLFLPPDSLDPLLHPFSHLRSLPPPPLVRPTILSSRKRLQWWKGKDFKQSHRPTQGAPEAGELWLEQSLRRGAHPSEALHPKGD